VTSRASFVDARAPKRRLPDSRFAFEQQHRSVLMLRVEDVRDRLELAVTADRH